MAHPHTRLSALATPGPAWIVHAPDGVKGTKQYTKLSVQGISGPPWITHTPDNTRLADLFTKLSVQATPGPRWIIHRPDQVRGADLFTELQVYATPGKRHSFLAKGIVSAEDLGRIEVGAGSRFPYKRKLDIRIPTEMKISMEETEIMELLVAILRIL